jgi:hypothetical protein
LCHWEDRCAVTGDECDVYICGEGRGCGVAS